jgi:hypothetical protein
MQLKLKDLTIFNFKKRHFYWLKEEHNENKLIKSIYWVSPILSLFVYLFVYLYVYLYVYLFDYLYFYLFVCLSVFKCKL